MPRPCKFFSGCVQCVQRLPHRSSCQKPGTSPCPKSQSQSGKARFDSNSEDLIVLHIFAFSDQVGQKHGCAPCVFLNFIQGRNLRCSLDAATYFWHSSYPHMQAWVPQSFTQIEVELAQSDECVGLSLSFSLTCWVYFELDISFLPRIGKVPAKNMLHWPLVPSLQESLGQQLHFL